MFIHPACFQIWKVYGKPCFCPVAVFRLDVSAAGLFPWSFLLAADIVDEF
jgi:hypothetical protein